MTVKNNKFIRRLFIVYSSLILVVLIMGVYLYSISIENVSQEIRRQNKLSLEKTVSDMDKTFKAMDLFASQLVTNSNLVHLSNEDDTNQNEFYLQAYHAINEMGVYVYTESTLPIKDHFIYLPNPNYIISLSQFTELELYYTGIKSYDRKKFDDWKTMLNTYENMRQFIPIDKYKTLNDSTKLYMLPLTEYTLKKVPATLCFEIDYGRLKEIFSELKFFDTGYLYVMDHNGDTAFEIHGIQESLIPVEQLKNLEYIDNYASLSTESGQMFVTTGHSSFNNWTYYLVQPVDASLYSLEQYRNIFITIVLIALLFIILMIVFLSRSNVKKITQLGNELEDTITEQQTLARIVERQKPIIVQSYLQKILEGNISTIEELDYARQYMDIEVEGRKFSVLHLVAYVNQYELYVENSAVTVPDNIDYQEVIMEVIHDFFGDSVNIFRMDEREYSVLLASPLDTPSDQSSIEVAETFTKLHDFLKNRYSIWTFAGLGDWNPSLMVTWKSYQQAIQTVSYTTKRKIFCCYANIERDTNTFFYPIELTKQLTNFITTGNESQVLEIFEVIRHENMEVRSLPIHMMKYLLSDIRNTLYKIRFTIKPSADNEASLGAIDLLFDEHMTLKLYEDLAVKLCEMFENNTAGNRQIATIKNYIDDNFRDPSLCLNKISDEFDISESYFSYLFKEETGVNFSTYLGKIRMEHAWKLLAETDINISDIFDKVGYNNSHSFRRTFKKTYGVSPKEARSNVRSS